MSRVYRFALLPVGLVVLGACGSSAHSNDTSDVVMPAGGGTAAAGFAAGPGRRFADIGRSATVEEIRAWDIDANPAGIGLPAGQGSHERGATVYARQCASCHGMRGEGIAPNPGLIGRAPSDFTFAADYRIPKTIGNYWPYATTLYDYINRAMPFANPGSLSANDVYSVTAFLLAENGIIEKTTIMNARSLPHVRMPARDRFVRDDRKEGATFR